MPLAGRKRERAETVTFSGRAQKISRSSSESAGSPDPLATTSAIATEDFKMDDDLADFQGASRALGGVIRGKAVGNVFNFADGGMDFIFFEIA